MEDTLRRFHTFKDIFLLRRDSKEGKAKANALRTDLVKMRKVDKETNAEDQTPSKTRREMNASRDYISLKRAVSKELDADYNFLKINLTSHWVEQLCHYGAWQH